jgi:hypothetical protein
MYGVRLILKELSLTFLNTSKGPYHRALILLLGSCSLSLLINYNHTLSPTLNVLFILCWSCLALYFSCDFFNVSYTCKWICLIFSIIFSSFNASPVRSSLTPPCYPYTISKGEGGKHPNQVFKRFLTNRIVEFSFI